MYKVTGGDGPVKENEKQTEDTGGDGPVKEN